MSVKDLNLDTPQSRFNESVDFTTSREKIRALIEGVYGIQKVRIATGNRVAANFRADLARVESQSSDVSMEEDAEVASLLDAITAEYASILQYAKEAKSASGSKITAATISASIRALEKKLQHIKDYVDYSLVTTYIYLCEAESTQLKTLKCVVEQHPMWERFFKDVKGCGPAMAGMCLAYLNPYAARHASSFWKYTGLDVVHTDKGMKGRSMALTEEREYVDKQGNIRTKKSLTYNPELKTKLVGVLGGAFLKAKDSKYGKIYYDYKNRLDNRVDSEELTKAHKHRMAIRYAVKIFLADLWAEWRAYEGLSVSKPYAEAYLGRNPHGSDFPISSDEFI